MKKFVAIAVAILSLVMCLSFAGCGDKKVEGTPGLDYQLSADETYYIFMGVGTCQEADIVIGNWHEGKPVKGIGERVMREVNVDINSITVSKGVSEFADAALTNFTVKTIVLPDGLETAGTHAFFRCTELTKLVIGKGMKKFEASAFASCGNNLTIYFRGSEAEWNKIEVDPAAGDMSAYTVVFNYKGE